MAENMPVILHYGTIHDIKYSVDYSKEPDFLIVHTINPQTDTHKVPIVFSGNINDQPMLGDKILYIQLGANDLKIIKTWSNNPTEYRSKEDSLLPGETQVQSVLGRCYAYFDVNGNINITTGCMQDSIKLLNDARLINIEAANTTIQNHSGASFAINSKNELLYSVVTKDENDNPITKCSLHFKDDASLEITSNNYIVKIDKDGNAFVDAKMTYLGTGASDASKNVKFGDVVTSGAFGTHPFCLVTGAPIIGSVTVKASDKAG